MHRLSAPLLLIVAPLAALGPAACRPKVGDACKPGDSSCVSPSRALACRDGKLAPEDCGGPKGCVTLERGAYCDRLVGRPGDPCDPERGDRLACHASAPEALRCDAGKLAVAARCAGPKGCSIQGTTVLCDLSRGAPLDPCPKDGAFTCSADGKSVLVCDRGALRVSSACLGPKGCTFGAEVACDDSVAAEGAPCDTKGQVACGPQLELTCDGTRFVRSRACRSRCAVEDRAVTCD